MKQIKETIAFWKKRDKLVLTLLVKNEADIIVDNIFYHYSRGVDKVIVTDNGSSDGTYEILQHLERQNLIHLIRQEVYNQDKLVNQMGKVAKETYGATILIHADADEFWTPVREPDLKTAYLKLEQPAVLVQRHDTLPIPAEKYDKFPQQHMNIVTKHLKPADVKEASKKVSLFLCWLPPKVMFTVKEQLKQVGTGNHFLTGEASGEVTTDMVIYHFPFKSADRFIQKVKMAGQVFEEVETDAETWWHWKRWYTALKNGTIDIDKEIDLLVPDMGSVMGIKYEKFDYQEKVLREIKKNRKLLKAYEEAKTLEHQWLNTGS